MKKLSVLFLVTIVVLTMSILGSGCAQQEAPPAEPAAPVEEPAAEPAAEEPAVEAPAEALGPLKLFTDKPGWQTGWDAVFADFKDKTGIDVEMTGYTEIDTYIAAIKTGIPTREGPDVFTWWSNFKIEDLAKEGFLASLDGFYQEIPGKYNPGILDSFSYEDTVYGAPVLVASWVMFYNIPVFEEYGLEEPQTWDEFMDLCETLKENGVTPIGFTIDGGWTSFFWFQQIMASNFPEAYYAVCQGNQSWDSDEVRQTFEIWKEMLEKGYFSDPGIDLSNELPLMFGQGEVAMTYVGDWFTAYFDATELVGGEDYSMFIIPPFMAGRPKTVVYEAGPLVISENAANKEAAEMFIEYWLSDEGQATWSEAMQFVSPNADVPADDLDAVKQKISNDVFGDPDAELVVRFWEATLETISLPACASFDKFVLNPDNVEAVIAELDEMSQAAWAEYEAR